MVSPALLFFGIPNLLLANGVVLDMLMYNGILGPLTGRGGLYYVRRSANGSYVIVPRARRDAKTAAQLEQRRRLLLYVKFASKIYLSTILPLAVVPRRFSSAWNFACHHALANWFERDGYCMSSIFPGAYNSVGNFYVAYRPGSFEKYIAWYPAYINTWLPTDKVRFIIYCQDPYVLWYNVAPVNFEVSGIDVPSGVIPRFQRFLLYMIIWRESSGKVVLVGGDMPRLEYVWF